MTITTNTTRALRMPAILLSGALLALTACGSDAHGDSAESATEFCNSSEASLGALNALDGYQPPSSDDYKNIENAIRRLADDAPGAIRSDLSTIADGASNAAETGSGFTDSTEVVAAAQRVDAFVVANCVGGDGDGRPDVDAIVASLSGTDLVAGLSAEEVRCFAQQLQAGGLASDTLGRFVNDDEVSQSDIDQLNGAAGGAAAECGFVYVAGG